METTMTLTVKQPVSDASQGVYLFPGDQLVEDKTNGDTTLRITVNTKPGMNYRGGMPSSWRLSTDQWQNMKSKGIVA